MADESEFREISFRDEITADFKAGKVGIDNGWLVAYTDPCPSPCAGPYGCAPGCEVVPIVDLYDLFKEG